MYEDMVKTLKESQILKKKSAFEEIVNILFTNAEKEQVLIDLGWRFYITQSGPNSTAGITMMERGDESYGIGQLEVVFLREISIKFKNLLLAKTTLKIKL